MEVRIFLGVPKRDKTMFDDIFEYKNKKEKDEKEHWRKLFDNIKEYSKRIREQQEEKRKD